MSYFYNQAAKVSRRRLWTRPSIAIPGPSPISKETGIVMLADSVEAVVRSVKTTLQRALLRSFDKSLDERISEGELHDCDLTIRDLEEIKSGVHRPF